MFKFRVPINDWPINASKAEWCRILDVSNTTVDRAIARGDLERPVVINARVLLFSRESIYRWLKIPVETELETVSAAPAQRKSFKRIIRR